MQIGVFATNLGLGDPYASLERAASIPGVRGVQVGNVGGPLDPANLDAAARGRFREQADRLGLTIAALCGHQDFVTADDGLQARAARFEAIMDLAVQWGTPIVTTESGHLAPGADRERAWDTLVGVVRRICRHGERVGAYFALEASGSCFIANADDLGQLIDAVDSPALRVNFDPANFVMFGNDPIQGVRALGRRIVHTHAKDGLRQAGGRPREVPLGQGGVPWTEYLAALRATGYDGFLTIERETGPDPARDIAAAADFLAQCLRG